MHDHCAAGSRRIVLCDRLNNSSVRRYGFCAQGTVRQIYKCADGGMDDRNSRLDYPVFAALSDAGMKLNVFLGMVLVSQIHLFCFVTQPF